MRRVNGALPGILALMSLILMATSAHGGVRKCVDEKGRIVFSDKPCIREEKQEVAPTPVVPTQTEANNTQQPEKVKKGSIEEIEQRIREREAVEAQQEIEAQKLNKPAETVQPIAEPIRPVPAVRPSVAPPQIEAQQLNKPAKTVQPIAEPMRPVPVVRPSVAPSPGNVGGAAESAGGAGSASENVDGTGGVESGAVAAPAALQAN